MIGVPLRVYAPRNKFIFHGKFNYTFFPEYYYGVATEDPESKKDTIEYNRIAFDLRFYWKIKRHLFAGFATRYNNISKFDAGPNGKFYEDEPLGHDGYWLLGFAPALTFETATILFIQEEDFM